MSRVFRNLAPVILVLMLFTYAYGTTVANEAADKVSDVPVHKLFFDGFNGDVVVRYTPTHTVRTDLIAIKAHGFDGVVLSHHNATIARVAKRYGLHVLVNPKPDVYISASGNCGASWVQGIINSNHVELRGDLKLVEVDSWSAVRNGVDLCTYWKTDIDRGVVEITTNEVPVMIDHYELFIDNGNGKLVPLVDLAPTTKIVDLNNFRLKAGVYSIYLKMVGKPLVRNKFTTQPLYFAKL